MTMPMQEDLFSRLRQIESKIDMLQNGMNMLAREAAKTETSQTHICKDLESVSNRVTAIDNQMPDMRVALGKLQVSASILGALAGFFGGKL